MPCLALLCLAWLSVCLAASLAGALPLRALCVCWIVVSMRCRVRVGARGSLVIAMAMAMARAGVVCPRRPLWRYEQRNVYGAIQKPCEAEAAALATQRQCRRRRPVSNSFQALRLVVSHTHTHAGTHTARHAHKQIPHANMQSMVSCLSRRRSDVAAMAIRNMELMTACLTRTHMNAIKR